MVTLAQAGRLIDIDVNLQQPVFLWGPPGVGKSEKVHQLLNKRQERAKSNVTWGMIDFRAVLRDAVAMLGVPDIDRKKQTTIWFPPDELPQADRDGEFGFLFLDELNAAHQQVQAACFGLVLDRVLGKYKLPKGWTIIAAGNRQSDKSAAQRMPRALANRFHHIEVEAHLDTWITDFALNNDIDEQLISFLRWRESTSETMHTSDTDKGGSLFHVMDVDDERKFPTPRSWTALNKGLPEWSKEDRIAGFEGHVGMGAATEFNGFLNIIDELPDFDEIVTRPNKAMVPEEISAKYALAGSLGRNAERDNFDAVLTYAQRLGREYDIVVGIDATKRDEMLCKTKAYTQFIQRNKDIQIGSFRIG